MSATIPACYFLGNSQLEWREIPDPREQELGPTDILVKILYVGICGTDIFGFPSKMPFFNFNGDSYYDDGRVFGHEFSCLVVATGKDVKNVAEGDICSYVPYTNCYDNRPGEQPCRACRQCKYNACQYNLTQAVAAGIGGMRPYAIFPAKKLITVKDTDPKVVSIVEMLAVSANAVMQCAIPDDSCESILINGQGPIGVGAAHFASLVAERVFVSDLDDTRRRFGQELFGAIPVEDTSDIPGYIQDQNDGEGVAYAIEATGVNAVMTKTYESMAADGTVALVGVYKSDPGITPPYGDEANVHLALPWTLHHKGQMTTRSCRNGNYQRVDGRSPYVSQPQISAFDWVVDCLASKKVDPSSYIQKEVPASEIRTAEDFTELIKPDGTVKTVIQMDLLD